MSNGNENIEKNKFIYKSINKPIFFGKISAIAEAKRFSNRAKTRIKSAEIG